MAWIRLDCSILSDRWVLYDLTAEEFKAWSLFLLRVKSEGARGTVKVADPMILSAQWFVSEESVKSMLRKAVEKGNVEVVDKRWHVKNWWKYQEEHKKAFLSDNRQSSGEFPEDACTVAHPTPPHTTPQYTTSPPPTDVEKVDWDAELLKWWGREGNTGWGFKTELAAAAIAHGRQVVLDAIQASSGAKNKQQYFRKVVEKRTAPVPSVKRKGEDLSKIQFWCDACQASHRGDEVCPKLTT